MYVCMYAVACCMYVCIYVNYVCMYVCMYVLGLGIGRDSEIDYH